MPEEMERKLKAKAKKKFGSTTSKKARAYIYGTMRKTGWTPKAQDGMINADAGTNLQQPAAQSQPQGQPQGQPAPQPQGISVIVTMVANAPDGSQQPIGTVTVTKPDDLKQVIQKVVQVFQQGAQPQGGQPEGQPAQPQGQSQQPTQQ